MWKTKETITHISYFSVDLVTEALKEYFKDLKISNTRAGHFIRKSSDVKSYCVSKAIDKVANIPPKFPWMAKL